MIKKSLLIKLPIFFLLSVMLLVFCATKTRAAYTINEQPLSTIPSWKALPNITSNLAIYSDSARNGGDPDTCYIFNFTTGLDTAFAPFDCNLFTPEIYGRTLVWENKDGGVDWNIYAYNLDTLVQTQITDEAAEQTLPDIYGNKVVWQDKRNGSQDIYMYNLDTAAETRITTGAGSEITPRIYNDKIVWEDDRNGDEDIYLYNLTTSTETRLTTDGSDQTNPEIAGNKVVYDDNRNGNPEVYMYNIDTQTETRITNNINSQTFPRIDGNIIVWRDDRNSPGVAYDVYLYDLAELAEKRVSTITNRFAFPSISGNRILWDDDRNYPGRNGADIYMATLNTVTPVVRRGSSGGGGSSFVRFQGINGSKNTINLAQNEIIRQTPYTIKVQPTSKYGIKKVDFSVGKNLVCSLTGPNRNNYYSCSTSVGSAISVVTVTVFDNKNHRATITRKIRVLTGTNAWTIIKKKILGK